MSAFRAQLRAANVPLGPLLERATWPPLRDIALDFLLVGLAVAMARYWYGLAPLAILVIGNRQRALGNLLHEGGHGNLHRARSVNDAITRLLLAPALFASLSHYRPTHWKHHQHLGDTSLDPDHLDGIEGGASPLHNYLRRVFSARCWWSSICGHLCEPELPLRSRVAIAVWWAFFLALLAATAGLGFAGSFVILWATARATVFHLIFVFREMCDHFGPAPVTRDVLRTSPWAVLIHPHNNGYHLTHHLLPSVPYYHLPAAQRLFSSLPAYRRRGHVLSSYVRGEASVLAGWHTGSPA